MRPQRLRDRFLIAAINPQPGTPGPCFPRGSGPACHVHTGPAKVTLGLQVQTGCPSQVQTELPPRGWGPGAILRRRTAGAPPCCDPWGQAAQPLLVPMASPGRTRTPAPPPRAVASLGGGQAASGGRSLHHFASDHQLAGVSHPHPAPAQGPSPGVLASLSLSDGDRQAPFVPSPEDWEQAGFMAEGPVHRAGVRGEVPRGNRGLVSFSWANVWGSSALTQTGGGDVARRRTPWVICRHHVDAGEDP